MPLLRTSLAYTEPWFEFCTPCKTLTEKIGKGKVGVISLSRKDQELAGFDL